MSGTKKISVIVPVYKIENYLDQCVTSIVNQTYKNLEIILVDDGSPDRCGVICDRWAQTDPRIVVIHKENGGLSDARNTGIEHATGELIGFVDGDDYIAPKFYEVLLDLMERYDQSVVECGCVYFQDGSDAKAVPEEREKRIKILPARDWLTETNVGEYLPMVAWNKLYDIGLFTCIRYPKGRLHEDEATTYKLIYKAGSIVRTYERLYFYRRREGSITSNEKVPLRSIEHGLLAFKERAEYFEDLKETEISNFAKAKYCLSLCYVLRNTRKLYPGNDRETKRSVRDEVKRSYDSFRNDKSVPLKYRLFISTIVSLSYILW